jgi:hypothetical protein
MAPPGVIKAEALGYGRLSLWGCAKCCARLLRRASYPRQFGGVLPGLPGLFAVCRTRGVFTAHGTKRLIDRD